ncbi:MAG: transposase [Candidatus Rhabdochlamydia sp.]
MTAKPPIQNQAWLFKPALIDMLDPDHKLCKLAHSISWQTTEKECAEYFTAEYCCPPIPARILIGILIIQDFYKDSDEEICRMWIENMYWQALCGCEIFQHDFPVHFTALTKWREKLGPLRVKKIVKLAISSAGNI